MIIKRALQVAEESENRTVKALAAEVISLRELVTDFNQHMIVMQADCEKYLVPDSGCSIEWLTNRTIWNLDGPVQRTLQERAKHAETGLSDPRP
jgi:hypothetical protein